ncbi:MAG TPA: hypothetical protein ENI80_01755 [Acidiferrobacteraceae bacterium]|nr:hypothetical protein [Acidiferrobacteraceae bacterium]
MDCAAIGYINRSEGLIRTVAATVIVTFLTFYFQPLALAVKVAKIKDTATNQSAPRAPRPQSDEENLAQTLEKIERKLEKLDAKLTRKQDASLERRDLKKLHHQLLALDKKAMAGFDKLKARLKKKKFSNVIMDRHEKAVSSYRNEIQVLKTNLLSLESATDPTQELAACKRAANHIQKKQTKRAHSPLDPNNLPFGTPKAKARKPAMTKQDFRKLGLVQEDKPIQLASTTLSPGMLVAQADSPGPEHLAPTEDVQITQAIIDKAQELNNNPVEIYNWVHNNIEFLPTYGSIQGSDMTLLSKRGNAFDTSSLLIALLRASGIHSRYVYGTVEIPIDKVMNWVGGVEKPEAALQLLAQGGIPNTGLTSGGVFKAVRMEHIWVEAWVDFEPSRGAKHNSGDTWVPMDGSFKQNEILGGIDTATISGINIAQLTQDFLSSGIINESESWMSGFNPMILGTSLNQAQQLLDNYIKNNLPNATLEDVIGGEKIVKQVWPVLPSGLPYMVGTIGARYSTLPGSLRHQVTLELYTTKLNQKLGSPALQHTISLPKISMKRLGISYIPTTSDDTSVIQAAVDSGFEALPLYLISVKPVIKLDDNVVAIGSPVTMGSDQYLDVALSSPIENRRVSYNQIAGDEMVVSINGAGLFPQNIQHRRATNTDMSASENLHIIALSYWAEADVLSQAASTTYGVKSVRLPSIGLFSSPLSVTYNFGFPFKGNYINRTVDIKLSLLAVAGGLPSINKKYVQYVGILQSYLEGSILEQVIFNWQGTGLSAAQVMLDSNQQNIKIYTVNASNASQIISRLQISNEIVSDINSALQQGFEVIVSEKIPVKAVGRSGIGYIITDPKTGSGAYRISSGLDGGEGEAPCAEPELQPLVQAIKYIVLTIVVLAMVALAAALVAGSSGTALPALPSIMAAVGLSALTFPATAGGLCDPIPLGFHKGGPQGYRSGLCADTVIGNQFPGGDVCVNGVAFDALTGSTLWEVKAIDFSGKQDFIIDSQVNKDFEQRGRQLGAIASCPTYSLGWAIGDGRHFQRQVERLFPSPLVQHRHVPECLLLPKAP